MKGNADKIIIVDGIIIDRTIGVTIIHNKTGIGEIVDPTPVVCKYFLLLAFQYPIYADTRYL